MTQLERLETKASLIADEAGTVTGIAWPFGAPDSVGDLIEPAGVRFAARVPMLMEHDQKAVVGQWDNLAVTAEGIEVKGGLFIDGAAPARDARQTMQRGLMNGLSIGYQLHEAKARPEGGRVLKSITITEISLCRRPVHPTARVTEVKSEGMPMTTTAAVTTTEEVKAADLKAANDNIAALTKRLEDAETKLARPAIHTKAEPEVTPERKAFTSFLRHGPERMQAEETKALNISTDTAGGYLATPEFTTEIVKNLVEISPIRQVASIRSTSAASVILPKRTGTPTGAWVSETGTRTGTESAYGQQEIAIHEASVYVDVSVQLLEDAAVNVEAEVASDLAEEFARLEGAAFVNGDGLGKPKGFLTSTEIGQIISGSAATIPNADVLINMFYGLKAPYRTKATWAMNATTLATVRKFKDSTGAYIWQPGLQAGEPSTLLGRPVLEDSTMPDIGAGALPIALGDFSGYRIYDRVSMSILRDPYTQAGTGKVRFYARRRVGGDVVQAEGLKLLKVSAT